MSKIGNHVVGIKESREYRALGRIEGAKAMQEAVEATLDKCGEPCPQCGDAIRALDPETVTKGKP